MAGMIHRVFSMVSHSYLFVYCSIPFCMVSTALILVKKNNIDQLKRDVLVFFDKNGHPLLEKKEKQRYNNIILQKGEYFSWRTLE